MPTTFALSADADAGEIDPTTVPEIEAALRMIQDGKTFSVRATRDDVVNILRGRLAKLTGGTAPAAIAASADGQGWHDERRRELLASTATGRAILADEDAKTR